MKLVWRKTLAKRVQEMKERRKPKPRKPHPRTLIVDLSLDAQWCDTEKRIERFMAYNPNNGRV